MRGSAKGGGVVGRGFDPREGSRLWVSPQQGSSRSPPYAHLAAEAGGVFSAHPHHVLGWQGCSPRQVFPQPSSSLQCRVRCKHTARTL